MIRRVTHYALRRLPGIDLSIYDVLAIVAMAEAGRAANAEFGALAAVVTMLGIASVQAFVRDVLTVMRDDLGGQ